MLALLLTLVASGVGLLMQAQPPPTARGAAREWRRPVDWYPVSANRWFVNLPRDLEYSEVRFHEGDNAAWADPRFDDGDWTITGAWDLPARHGVDWARLRVRLRPGSNATLPAGVMISTVRAYELYWDGVQLGRNGEPGRSAAEEVPGRTDAWFSIPAGLLGPGEHVVALRTSSHRCGFPAPTSGFRFLMDSPGVLQRSVLREAFLPTLAAGALDMLAAASFIMWLLAARRSVLLLLSGLCLAGAVMQSLQAMRWFFAYPADWHYPVLSAMTTLLAVQIVLTVALITILCGILRRGWVIGLLVPVLALASWLSPSRLNLEGVRILAIGLGVSLACSGWAAWKRRRGALPVALGVAVSFLLLVLEAEDYRATFFIKFLPALVGLIAAIALQLHDERRRAHDAQLAAARLELELLKRNLQPHFLLNTLAVLSEIVEQEPRRAVRLIEDLADEFRAVARVAAEKLIPLSQELELCRAHLRVMSARLGRECTLQADGLDESARVPPAVFLTLIENGFAHQTVAESSGVFLLQRPTADNGATRYAFVSPGAPRTDGSRPSAGIGLRYVKARLEESFPGRWRLNGELADGGWRTEIEIAGE